MAFTSILRRSASSLAPLVGRLARGHRSYQSAVVAATNRLNGSHATVPAAFVPAPRYYAVTADESLIKVIEAEMKCAEETDDLDKVEEVPLSYPFKIEDIPGTQTVTLTRTYEGEKIEVLVHMPNLVTGDEDDADDSEEPGKNSIPLEVTISKDSGPTLEFNVTAYADEIEIDSLIVRNPEQSEDQIAYEGPDFNDLDENLKKAFHKYLEIRGLRPYATNFLHEYMLNKDSKEYMSWLQKLKKFVEA